MDHQVYNSSHCSNNTHVYIVCMKKLIFYSQGFIHNFNQGEAKVTINELRGGVMTKVVIWCFYEAMCLYDTPLPGNFDSASHSVQEGGTSPFCTPHLVLNFLSVIYLNSFKYTRHSVLVHVHIPCMLYTSRELGSY